MLTIPGRCTTYLGSITRAALLLPALATTVAASGPLGLDDPPAGLARHYGFGPMQIYKFRYGTTEMRLADLNGDQRTDILLWNGQQSRFELLYQPDPAKPAAPAEAVKLERNDLPNRGPMRTESLPVAYRAASVQVADMTADGRNDIVFFGEPRELVILAGKAEGGFAPPVGVRAAEGNPRGGSLTLGDFNHDGKTDAVVLGDEVLLLFLQSAGGGLSQPQRLVHNVRQPLGVFTADLNGDQRDDLMLTAADETYGLHVRLQDAGGTLGPQRSIKIPMLRSITVAKAALGDDVFAVEHATGRLKQFRWERPDEAAADPDWPRFNYPYPTVSRGKSRPMAVGDVTGDGLADVVVADPDAAQLVLFQQTAGRGLLPGVGFPGLVKTVDVQIADLDGDATNEVLSISTDEKTLGVSKFADGRLTFPTPLAITGTPYVAAVGALKTGEPADRLAYISKTDDGLAIRVRDRAAQEKSYPIAKLDDDPAGIRFADVNQDGLSDLLIFVRFAGVVTYVQSAEGGFALLGGPDTRDSLVKKAGLEGYALADVTGDGKPEVVLAQKNFARALAVRDGRWEVVDQYNPENADAELGGLCAIPGDPGSPTLVMYDRRSQDMLVLRRRADKAYGVVKTFAGGSLELTAMDAAPVGGSAQHAVVMADAALLAVIEPGVAAASFVEKQTYETSVKDAWLADSVVGDLNGDGVRDVIAVDVVKAHIEVLATLADGGLVRATRFQVFQGKRFSDAPDSRGEPHEVLVADVTGDKIDDIVALAHDRVLVYPGQ